MGSYDDNHIYVLVWLRKFFSLCCLLFNKIEEYTSFLKPLEMKNNNMYLYMYNIYIVIFSVLFER